jgi:hypothetical protein
MELKNVSLWSKKPALRDTFYRKKKDIPPGGMQANCSVLVTI